MHSNRRRDFIRENRSLEAACGYKRGVGKAQPVVPSVGLTISATFERPQSFDRL